MEDGAKVPLEQTATPVELDQVYGALDELSAALGPNGANKDGALSDLVDVGAANLDGQRRGPQPHAHRLLAGGGDAERAPRRPVLARWTTCRRSRPRWRASTRRWARSTPTWRPWPTCSPRSGRTSPRRSSCSTRRCRTSPGSCRTTRRLLTTNVNRLADVTLALVQQRQALAEVLDVAPAALGNLSHAYNPDYGTLDTRDNSVGSTAPEVIVCQILAATGRVTIEDLPVQIPTAPDPAADDAGGHLRPAAVRRRGRGERPRRRQRQRRSRPAGTADPARRRRWPQRRLRRPCGRRSALDPREPGMNRTPMRRRLRQLAALCTGVLVLAGCGFRGAYSFSLPGGADVGDDPYTVQVEFLDVLDLVQQSGVRVADVPVGRVDKIELADDWTALVTLTVNGDVDLPANAVAKIQQSSLLGEKFVELARARQRGARRATCATTRGSRWSGPTATSRSRSCSARSRWCSTAAAWPSCRRSTGSSATRWRAGSPRSRSTLDRARHLHRRPRPAEGRDQPRAGQRQRARRHPRGAHRHDRHRPGHHRPRPGRHQPAARPARVDAGGPGAAGRRRHPDHQPVGGRHRGRPAAAAAHPDPAGGGRARPRRVAGPAADLPVPGQLGHRAGDGGPPR